MVSISRKSCTPAMTVLFHETKYKKPILHRLYYVAKVPQKGSTDQDLTGHYQSLFHKQIKSHLGDSVSGLLLIYPSCVIHMIESSSEILYGIIQDLVHIQNQGSRSLLQDVRILVNSHNVPSRLLPQWFFHEVHLGVQYLSDITPGQPVEPVVEDCLTSMLKLGVFLSQMVTPESKGPGENQIDQVVASELLVREEMIHFLIKSDMFLKPEEFLAMYDKPMNASCDSDQVWPATQQLYL